MSKRTPRLYTSAIVGCGRIGCFLGDDPKRKKTIWTHAAAYAACSRTTLTAFVDVDPKARARAARRWGVKNTYPDLNALLRHQKIDILSICTPSDSHGKLFEQALQAGVPAIWCEKPMSRSLAEADRMIAMSKNKVIEVNHTRRWDRPYEITHEWLRKEKLGKMVAMTAWYSQGISNIGSHLFDTLRYLRGEATWVLAVPDPSGDPDPSLSGLIGFAKGPICHVVGAGRDNLIFEIEILCAKGRLRISANGFTVGVERIEASQRFSGYQELGKSHSLWKGTDGRRMLTALEDIVHGLDHRTIPRCSARDGMKSVELVAAFMHSAKIRQRVNLPLPAKQRRLRLPVR